jgi:intracellular septation protein A
MEVLIVIVYYLLISGGVFWVCYNAFKNDGTAAGLMGLIFFPYLAYYAAKRFKQNRAPITLFAGGVAIGLVHLVLHSYKSDASHELAANEIAVIVVCIIAVITILISISWITINAFNRNGMLAGVICAVFWPYAMYYGGKNFTANKVPMLMLIVAVCLCFAITATIPASG